LATGERLSLPMTKEMVFGFVHTQERERPDLQRETLPRYTDTRETHAHSSKRTRTRARHTQHSAWGTRYSARKYAPAETLTYHLFSVLAKKYCVEVSQLWAFCPLDRLLSSRSNSEMFPRLFGICQTR
jgi:hypothetical protein